MYAVSNLVVSRVPEIFRKQNGIRDRTVDDDLFHINGCLCYLFDYLDIRVPNLLRIWYGIVLDKLQFNARLILEFTNCPSKTALDYVVSGISLVK